MRIDRKVMMAGLVSALTLISVSCQDTPSEPPGPQIPVPGAASEISLDGLVVSLSRGLTDASGFAFVSMAPGSLDGDHEIVLTNRDGGVPVHVTLLDGGFDPVAVAASPGDMLSFEVVGLTGVTSSASALLPIPLVPPVIVRTYPSKQRTSIPLNALILVVFSEPVEPSSITAETIRLLGSNGAVGLDFTLREEGTVVEARPLVTLLPSSDYTLEINTGIEDLGGEHLAEAESVEFSTEAADLGEEPFAVKLLPDTLRLPVGTYSGFLVAVDSGARFINVFPDPSLTWATTDPAVVSMDPVGNVGGVAIGEAYVTVEYEGEVDSALVIVSDSPPPGPFAVFPDGATVPVGAVLTFDISHPEGTERPDVTWSSTDPAVFVVDESGTITTVGAGKAYLVAQSETETDSADIDVFDPEPHLADIWAVYPGQVVLEVGGSIQLVLMGTTSSAPPPVQWVSQDPQTASVDADGLVQALAPGKTDVTAWFEDGSGTVALVDIVEVGGLGSVTLDPAEIIVAVGDTVPFEVILDATAAEFFGNETPGWSWSSAGEVLRFLPYEGVFEAVAPGVAHVTAHVGPLLSNKAKVTVED